MVRGQRGCCGVRQVMVGAAVGLLAACGGGGTGAWNEPGPGQRAPGLGGGTTLVADIRPGAGSSHPVQPFVFQDKLYFSADDGISGREWWVYDGVSVALLADLNPGPGGSNPQAPVEYDGAMYFGADDGTNGRELWRFDGTSLTIADEPIAGPASSFPTGGGLLHVYQGELLVHGWDDGSTGAELWAFDGSQRRLVKDFRPGAAHGAPGPVAVYRDDLYLAADDGVNGRELWAYDGSNVTLVADIRPGVLGSNPQRGFVHNDTLLFQARDGSSGDELFGFNGMSVALMFELEPGAGLSQVYPMSAFAGRLWGRFWTPSTGVDVFSWDGTSAPEVLDLVPGPGLYMAIAETIGEQGVLGDKLYFVFDEGLTGRELWTIDADGQMEQVFDLHPGSGHSSPGPFVYYRDEWYFRADDGLTGFELWRAGLASNAPPDCSAAVPSVASLWPANHGLRAITVEGVTDPDGDPVTIVIDSIHQDEPVQGSGSGSTAPDGSGVGTSTASVRAERAGGGDGRVYHIGFTATDGNGGSCSGVVKVAVPHNVGGTAGDGGAVYDSTASE